MFASINAIYIHTAGEPIAYNFHDLRIQAGSTGCQCASRPHTIKMLLCDVLRARPKPGEQDTFTEVFSGMTPAGPSKSSHTGRGGQVISVTSITSTVY